MQIDRIYYPVTTLGYGVRIGIWTIGCTHGCHNCSNPELWKPDPSKDISIDRIAACIKKVPNVDGITITGGDPFLQAEELLNLVSCIRNLGYDDILVYTGYTYEELQEQGGAVKEALGIIGVLIDGLYIDEKNDNKSIRGSSNQRIHIIDHTLDDRYLNVENWERKTQIVMSDNLVQAIGIPIKM